MKWKTISDSLTDFMPQLCRRYKKGSAICKRTGSFGKNVFAAGTAAPRIRGKAVFRVCRNDGIGAEGRIKYYADTFTLSEGSER